MSYSPFASPPETSIEPGNVVTPPASGRLTGVTVLAILSILFGITGIFGLLVSAAMMFAPDLGVAAGPLVEKINQDGAYRAFYLITLLIGIAFTVVLFVGGILLWKMSKLGPKMLIAYAIYAIVSGIVINVINIFWIFVPFMNEAESSEEIAIVVMSIVGGVVGGLIGLIFPIAILIYFSRPAVKANIATWGSKDSSNLQANPSA